MRAGVIRGMEGQGRQNLCVAVTGPVSDAGPVTAGRWAVAGIREVVRVEHMLWRR